jgi:very-short-patch-repair endonuclease
MSKEFWKYRSFYNFGSYRRPDYHVPWSQDQWDTRWHRDSYPIYEFRLESTNYYFKFKTKLKQKFENLESVKEIALKLRKMTGLQLITVHRTKENFIRECVFKEKPLDQISDGVCQTIFDWVVNARDRFIIPIFAETFPDKNFEKEFIKFLCNYFLDTRGKPIKNYYPILAFDKEKLKYRRKKRQHKKYAVPHKEAVESPIENIFEKGLLDQKVEFKKQASIFFNEKLFTKPDFVIEEPLIAIYCDGIEFHNDAQRIIKDKQQDRLLQRLGYMVYRFSGSEIISNLDNCIAEVLYEVRKKEFLKKGIDPKKQGWWIDL